MVSDRREAFSERAARFRRAFLALALAGASTLVVASAPLLAQAPPGSQAKPHGNLVFAARDHSFGSLLEGDEASFDFTFEVTGDAPVTITRVQSTCGCTVPILEVGGQPYGFGTVLQPGAKGFVRARVKTYDFVGAKSSQITVFSDAGENSIVLSISSFVRRFFVTEPEFLNLGEVLEGEKRKASVKVRTAEVPEFAIEGWGGARTRREVPLEANGRPKISEKEIRDRELEDALTLQPQPPGLAVKYERSAPNEWSIDVEVDASVIPVGSFLHTLRFRTGAQRAFDVRVQGVVLPLVGTLPSPRLAFGLLRRGQAKEISVALIDYDPAAEVKLLSATLATAELAQHLEIGSVPTVAKNDEAGRPTWPVLVKAKPSFPAGPFKGLLELRTDHPKYPVIQIEVTGFVR